MIEAIGLSFSFGARDLFRDANFCIEEGEHAVLVGSNGTGKSTLLSLITDPENYLYSGKLLRQDDLRIGYVNQYVRHEKERSLTSFEWLAEDFIAAQAEMDRLCEEMADEEHFEEASEKYQVLCEQFEAADGYNYESNIYRQLHLAGLDSIAEVCVAEISGGEYKLLQIIRRMMEQPELLIMDEPDVFLDFENLRGLRDLINSYKGTLLTVTHSRYLLSSCFDKVLALENCELRMYEGSYSEYSLELLRMKTELQEAGVKEREWIAIQEQLVERLRKEATEVISPDKGRCLRARVAYLERLNAGKTELPYIEVREPAICLPACEPAAEETENPPETVVQAENWSIAFDDEVLLQNVSFEVKAGEKVALVGPNGSGKSTMLRNIWNGNNSALKIQPGVKAAFLSQLHGEILDEDSTVFEVLERAGLHTRREAEALAASYLLDEDTLDRKVSLLSGGEKNLLQLALISRSDAELLLMDEPMSHLDLYSQLALEKAIQEYKGTVLLVSHDFYSIANCTDYVLLTENGSIRRMSGRAFRKMIYRDFFKRDYLELEQRKKELELKAASCVRTGDCNMSRQVCNELEDVILAMRKLRA